jgi:hypothetical protein
MSRPDPMPVDVISALGLAALEEVEEVEEAAGVDALPVDDIGVLMNGRPSAQVNQFIGNIRPDLSKRHTNRRLRQT